MKNKVKKKIPAPQNKLSFLKNLFSPTSVVLFVFSILSLRLLTFINSKSVNVLFNDQWELVTAFIENKNLFEIFRWQHGAHRQGLAFVIDKLLMHVTYWNTKVEVLFIWIITILACLFAIILKKRLFGKLSYSDVILPVIFLTLAQWEVFLFAPNSSYATFPQLLLFLYVLSWAIRDQYWKYFFVLIINYFLIYSGYGLFIGIITIILLAIDSYKNIKLHKLSFPLSLALFSLSILSFASFFVGYTFNSDVKCFTFPYPRFWEYPIYSGLMFSTFIRPLNVEVVTFTLSLFIFGLIILLCLKSLIRLMKKGINNSYFDLTLFILFGFSLLFTINTAIGRICLGFYSLYASRYITYLIPAYIGLYFYFFSLRSARLKLSLIIVYLVLVIYSGDRYVEYWSKYMDYYLNGMKSWARCYKEKEDVDYCDKSLNFKVYLGNKDTHLKYKLDYMKKNRLNLFAE